MGVRASDFCVACSVMYLVLRLVWKRHRLLLPGPPGWPILENLLDLQAHAPYRTLGFMSGKYGPIVSLKAMGTRYIVLNSFQVTKDLLEKKSAITSNRPHFTVAGDLVGWGKTTGFLQYGNAHQKHRKLFGQYFRTKSSLGMLYPAEEDAAKRFARNILRNPDNLMGYCRRTVASFILKISHGYDVKDDSDPLVEMADIAMRNISETMSPGRFLADFFPILRYLPEWFPGSSFLKDVKRWRKMVSKAVNTPYEFVLEHHPLRIRDPYMLRSNQANRDATPSFTSRFLRPGLDPEDEEILKWASFSMYLGGSDTTPSTLSAFFLAMTLYPEVFSRAQAEVDSVVGNDRLPTMQNRDALPCVNAICTELLRWNVVIPLPSHIITQDIVYEGYLIPKGSWLVANIWFILSDPNTYPDPERFDPERFLGEHQQPDPRGACFGWGRRLCLGARLAESMIFINVATALATLNVSRRVENGVEEVPKYEFEEGMIRRVKPFTCRIVPRSKKAEDLLRL